MDVVKIATLAQIVHETSRSHRLAQGDFSIKTWEETPQWVKTTRILSIYNTLKSNISSAEEYYEKILLKLVSPSDSGSFLWNTLELSDVEGELFGGPSYDRLTSFVKLRVINTFSIIDNFRKWDNGEYVYSPDQPKLFECHGLDTQDQVFFYEHDFYCLSNFSSFSLLWRDTIVATLEHGYHFEKFLPSSGKKDSKALKNVRNAILCARSAHVAFELAQRNKDLRRHDWDDVKVAIMLSLMRTKAEQHDYVARKLEETGDRELVEDSWRDDWWGIGPNGGGRNECGKCWMIVREERRKQAQEND